MSPVETGAATNIVLKRNIRQAARSVPRNRCLQAGPAMISPPNMVGPQFVPIKISRAWNLSIAVAFSPLETNRSLP